MPFFLLCFHDLLCWGFYHTNKHNVSETAPVPLIIAAIALPSSKTLGLILQVLQLDVLGGVCAIFFSFASLAFLAVGSTIQTSRTFQESLQHCWLLLQSLRRFQNHQAWPFRHCYWTIWAEFVPFSSFFASMAHYVGGSTIQTSMTFQDPLQYCWLLLQSLHHS